MPFLHLIQLVALFFVAVFVCGAAAAPREGMPAVTRLAVGIVMAMGGWFLGGFTGFALGISNAATATALAAVAVIAVIARRRAVAALAGEREVRLLVVAWLVFAAWSLGLLALVMTYSGGGWVADWFEHWQRTVFFVERQPLDTRFAVIYSLTARPPLANLLIALLLAPAGATFANFQVFMTLFGTLTVLPAWMAATAWGKGRRAGWWVVLLLMLNPLVAQNLTFAWTKLPTAFLVATAVYLAWKGLDDTASRRLLPAAALSLALAMLTHYSAGPWVIALAAGFLVAHRARLREVGFWRESAALASIFIVVLGVWVGWASLRFGWQGTMQSNTTAEEWHAQSMAQRIATSALNVRDTIVPFPLRGEPADGLIEQTSQLGRIRDVAFNVYQVNLLCAFGLGGLWLLGCAAAKRSHSAPDGSEVGRRRRRFLWSAIPMAIVLGILVHTPRDQWGLAHICLQPLILLGLSAAAAVLPILPARARVVWVLLAGIDFVFGIALHFGLESWALAPIVAPGGNRIGFLRVLSRSAGANANDKWAFNVDFLADQLHTPVLLVALWLALCLAWVILRTRTTSSEG